ncbi:hypothetical protein [Qaidamihabitans albus]|uniref:hypothetical protein n=1 Tax=Qaidamihabitans albus TaxID=2795733 RepID=UPI0018F19D19|nr:hypothetical protein [Qaidamihabitans albus]
MRTLPRGLRVLQTSDSAEMPCELEVLLADEMAISVLARPQNSDSELGVEQLCVVAHAGADGIARTLRAGEVEHWEPPHNSLVRLSACALLPPGVVAAKAGVAAGDVTLYPAEHQCTWGSLGGEEPNVQLDFVTAVQPPGDMAEDIAGRPSSVREATTSSVATCTVSTEQIEFARAVGGEREFAVVRLLFPASMGGEPCPVARELAEIAWGKLPPA